MGVILPGMPERLECEGATVAEALFDCISAEPRLRNRIFRRDGTPSVGLAVNGESMPPEKALATAVNDGDEIRLLPPAGAC